MCTEAVATTTAMTMNSILTFDGHEFRIKTARIIGQMNDPRWCDRYNDGKGKSLGWSICIETEYAEYDGDQAAPAVDFDGLPIVVKNWHDLAGYEIQWVDRVCRETDDRYATMYVFDHQLISNGSVRITAREGTRFQVVASGENERGKKFRLETTAEFTQITVQGSEKDSDATIRARLKEQIDDVNLVAPPFKRNGNMWAAIFRPREK